jgi:Tfp pilus assembly protein PilX
MKTNKNQSGFIIGTLLVIMLVVSVLIITVSNTTISNFQSASKDQYRVNAQFAADAGLDYGIHNLNLDEDWVGTSGEVNFYTTTTGKSIRTTYDVDISPGSAANKKMITSTAKVYSPDTSTTPKVTRIYQLEAEAVTSGHGAGSVVSGVGGLILNSNSKISGGDVYVNGKVTLNNNSQIGLSTNPVNVYVAHKSCPIPADATYPIVCGSGNGQPITLTGNAKIYGVVKATNQTTGTNMSNTGLVPNQTVLPLDMPPHDRAAQKAAVTTTMTAAAAKCTSGTVVWPANLKITGDLVVANNCTMTISGNVWFTGKVDLSNNAKIKVPDSLGTTRPTIMVDGQLGFKLSNNGVVLKNASNTGIDVITYFSRASCSPDCADVTGVDLYNTRNDLTIDLGNNGTAEYSVFYSRWSKVRISNNGALGAIAGQTIELGNNAVINFTATIPGSDNLTTTWVKRGYLRVFQ